MGLKKRLVKSLVTFCSIVMLTSTAMAGYGPGDGNDGVGPNDGTGNGPGDCTTTAILILNDQHLLAGGGQVQGDDSAQGDVQGDLGNGESPGDDSMGNQA